MSDNLLEIKNLHTYFTAHQGTVKAVNGVSLELHENSILGVVGESGSGKTVTALSILQLVPYRGRIVKGSILYKGTELLALGSRAMRRIRGREISLIFQDAQAALNPVLPIGKQVEEIMLQQTGMSKKVARSRTVDLLTQMGLPDPSRWLDRYPFQLSLGMAQRVVIAIGLALKPRVLIADEPTSNVDVTLQAEILHRLKQLQQDQHSAIMLITSDLGVIAQMAEFVAVMYGGSVVEYADTRALFAEPFHPYTWGMFQALPRFDLPRRSLRPMEGGPPNMIDPPDRCPFLARCMKATSQCRNSPRPELMEIKPGHRAACYNPMEYEQAAS